MRLVQPGAPLDGPYVVVAADGRLSAARALAGTANQIALADGGAGGSLTLSIPDTFTLPNASPTFTGLTLSGLTASRLLASDGSKALASVADLASWVAGTADRVTVTADGDGSITLSGPQDLAAASSPAFTGLTLTGSQTVAGYLRVGSNSAPQNTTAGDITGVRIAIGVDSAFGTSGRIARFAGTNTNTASGADMGINVEQTIAHTANSSTEHRAINFRNVITPSSGATSSRIQGGYFNNTNRSDAAITNMVGVVGFGLNIDSSSPSTVGAVTNVYGFDARVFARPSGSSTVAVTNAVAYDTTLWIQNSGATITSAYGFRLVAPGSGSTITSLAAFASAAVTRGTNNVGLLLGTTTIPSGNHGIYNQASGAAHIVEVVKGFASQTANLTEWRNSSDTVLTSVDKDGKFAVLAGLVDGVNIVVGTSSGTKIGTATTQKIGFWNTTPVIQQALSAYTSDDESGAYTGIDSLQVGTVYATVSDLNQLRVAYETLRAAHDDLRTKLQTTGIVA